MMGMFSALKALFGRNSQPTGAGSNVENGVRFLFADYSNAGLSEPDILDAVHENPAFWACLNVVATSIAAANIYVTRGGRKEPTHRVNAILRRPNKFHGRTIWMWIVASYLLALGRVYIFRLPDDSLIPLSPTHVQEWGNGLVTVQFGGVMFTDVEVDKDIVRITLPDLRQPYTSGTGLGSALAQEIDISDAAAKHEAGHLKNHARPDMVVNYQELSSENLIKVEAKWKGKHGGPSKSGMPLFTNATNVIVQPLTSSFKDLGLIELRDHSADVVRETWGIPPEILGDIKDANRATVDAADYLYKKNVVAPKLKIILEELSLKLLPLLAHDGEQLELASDSIVPDDKEFLLQVARRFPDAFMVNEIREIAGRPPVEEGDVSYESGSPMTVKAEPLPQPASRSARPMMVAGRGGSLAEEIHFGRLFKEIDAADKRRAA